MNLESFNKVYSSKGLEIFTIPFHKFKTNTITVYFHDNLKKSTVSLNALFPAVLRQGSTKYPTRMDISKRLQELYGTAFDCGISKKGEMQLMYFFVETIRDSFAAPEEKLLKNAFLTLFDIITDPLKVDGTFKKEYVEVEKENIIRIIEGRMNDKASYAVERCIEEMCEKEPFSIFEYGYKEDYESISAASLYNHYSEVLRRSPISVFITGEVNDEIVNLVKDTFSTLERSEISSIGKSSFRDAPSEVHYVEESLNVTQGKLCMGYRTNVDPATQDYYKLMVCNSVLGGGLHSKMFRNVREKEGLAYYAYSRLERFKGLMILSSGIEIGNKDKVIDIIQAQIEDLKNGNISDYEFNSAKKAIENSIHAMKDSQVNLADFHLGQKILGTDETLDSVIEKVNLVSKEDVVEISKVLVPDTIYFLTGVS